MKAEWPEDYLGAFRFLVFFVSLSTNNFTERSGCNMYNPIRLFTGTEQKFVMIQGYVRSVTESKRGDYNSVSFLVNSINRGPKAPLISVMCFDNTIGINFKKLTDNTKGRFVTIFAEVRRYEGKISYKAIAISIAPTEFKEETNLIDDSEVQPDWDGCEQLMFDNFENELPFPPSNLELTNPNTCATV